MSKTELQQRAMLKAMKALMTTVGWQQKVLDAEDVAKDGGWEQIH